MVGPCRLLPSEADPKCVHWMLTIPQVPSDQRGNMMLLPTLMMFSELIDDSDFCDQFLFNNRIASKLVFQCELNFCFVIETDSKGGL